MDSRFRLPSGSQAGMGPKFMKTEKWRKMYKKAAE